MKKFLVLPVIAGLLASCGGSTPDNSLSISNPELRTQYVREGTTTDFIACDRLEGNPTMDVRVDFTTRGTLDRVDVRLVGSDGQDDGYRATIRSNSFIRSSDRYKVIFTADSTTNPLPASAQPHSIIPTPTNDTVKIVRPVSPSIGRFQAVLVGYSTSGQNTPAVPSLTFVPVYSDCEEISDTGVRLENY
ncbi:hypothetical protein HNR42_000168 [Deinobacterium chartae]|uniref:Lipoprotein n=1 Tax=Deinobacterium chartae TaxID=521158 RepID=A0A841HV09_9DEIO|nr:hypothetical protein [Deinobacterium chartae]MBB6096756.1 hypothetical protein [Deinobacterium chartae]